MFDWNEEELVDIIWGEGVDNGDHIVPYPQGTEENRHFVLRDISKKQGSQETAAVFKPREQKTSGAKNDSPGCNQQNNSQAEKSEDFSSSRLDIDPWPDFPMPSRGGKAYADRNGWDSMGTEFSNSYIKDNSLDPTDMILQNDSELFGNGDDDKGSGSFLDYGWDSIGNLDDFDKIFRNDDSILGHEMVGNADELWPSSANTIYSQTQPFPLASASPNSGLRSLRTKQEQVAVKLEPPSYKDQVDESVGGKAKIASEEKAEDSTETTADTITFQSQLSSEKSRIRKHFKEKGNRQRKLLKCQKKPEEKSKARTLYGPSSPSRDQFPFVNTNRHNSATSTLPTFPAAVLNAPMPTGGPGSLRCLPASSSYLQTGYGYPSHRFSIMPIPSQIHSDKDQSQLVVDSYMLSPETLKYGSSMQKPPDVHSMSLAMTPQEKIEKLRRRQQMQAMLAIQQQKQKFGHQASYTDSAITEKFPQENQEEDATGSKTEVEENSVPAVEQDDSSKTSMLVNKNSLEEIIFYQLQSAIVKLDSRIRLCIRDSLFRLARSVTQRHNISDTSSTNTSGRDENEVIANEETRRSHDRSIRLPDLETDTNPIDRTVAHLLFHRSSEPCGRPLVDGLPESPIPCEKLPVQPKTEGCMNPNLECITNRLTDKQSISHYECQTSQPTMSVDPQQGDHEQSSPLDT